MADNFAPWWRFVMLPNHDGSANDTANDGAGSTRWGWTFPTYQVATAYADIPSSFDTMDQVAAGKLAKRYYWDRLYAGLMPAGCDVSFMDFAWNSGRGIKEIQIGLHVGPDSVVGLQTLNAIHSMAPDTFIQSCYTWRVNYFDSLGFRKKWPGLYSRAADCRDLSLKLARGVPIA